jgi:adenylosuccinate lyase
MISRYDRKEISDLWTLDAKFQAYLTTEIAILRAQEGSKIPRGTADKIRPLAKILPNRIEEIERTVQHDVIAFCTSITEQLPEDLGKYFHYGVTSSDIIDTATNLQIKNSIDLILPTLRELQITLAKIAKETQNLVTMGRSHGMYAEPMSFGQKILGHYAEFARRTLDLEAFQKEHLTGQFSGAVGNYTIVTPEEEAKACKELGLKVEAVSTQILPRDHIAKLIAINALIAKAIERLSTELRHLHRSEVGEIEEGFQKGQKGSSIMPHKKNPIAGENLTGIARVLTSHLSIALDNIVLWHERDISHSSAERLFLPDNLGLVYYAISRLNVTLKNLHIKKDVIEMRVKENFIYLSSYYLHYLLENAPLSREEAYEMVQTAIFEAQQSKNIHDFFVSIEKKLHAKKLISMDEENSWKRLNFEEIKQIYLKSSPIVFNRTWVEFPIPAAH